MRFEPTPQRKALGLTSLIDVIFLLLLFFMLASSFTRYQATQMASGASGGGAEVRPTYLRLHGDGRMDLNGRSVSPDELEERTRTLAETKGALLAIWSGPNATIRDVVMVTSLARAAGLKTVLVTGN
ncbi:biopolymer transporter ExbD [Roseibium sediminis]|uniref:biopolymer transporter ExbD n=1 Tax=Roseibium sediminis TaxID=1775174 RepID=UPI00123CA0E4|nr:biopolymer transporter ExbD [Roseibium sediminis]